MMARSFKAVLARGGLLASAAGLACGVIDCGLIDPSSEVGGLEGLRSVQAQLRPVDACKLDFNSRNVGVGQHHDSIRIYPCKAEFRVVDFPVSLEWRVAHPGIKFVADRASTGERWNIRVDKSRSFPELVAALEQLAPEIAAKYPAMRTAAVAQEAKEREARDRLEREQAKARERAKEPYPSK